MTRSDLGGWLRKAAVRLSGESEHPQMEAQVLAAEILKRDRSWIGAHPEWILTDEELSRLDQVLRRREKSEPLPYILGHWDFFGREFIVSPSVLIPRPETELLVETAVGWLKSHPDRRQALDMGTGSGCIAITLAVEIPDLKMTAVDISSAALDVAAQNIARWSALTPTNSNLSQRVRLIESDLMRSVQGAFDLICANLPYIPAAKLERLSVARYEPRMALDGGKDGLRVIERFFREMDQRLFPGGLGLFEIEAEQGLLGRQLARALFPGAEVKVLQDLAGLDRLIQVEKNA